MKSEKYKEFEKNPVAYFCAEYALSPTLPIYAGGLGVLAGDYIRETKEQKFPLIAIGIRYKQAQSMLSNRPDLEREDILTPVLDPSGEKLKISFLVGSMTVFAEAYQWNGYDNLYLLDTNLQDNTEENRKITENLYTDDREERFRQEIVLGIGGFELIKALGIKPKVFHLNEGHSAFLALALIKEKMDNGRIDFQSAKELARQQIVFTNHTLILEGQEMFRRRLFERQLTDYIHSLGVNVEDVWNMGATKDGKIFSMTNFAFNVSCGSNAVSNIHEEKAKILWPNEHPTAVVTNGIYLPRWDKLMDQGIWEKHQENKKKLIQYIFENTGERWDENVLLFGWARRFVEYKQPLLILQNVEKIKKMMSDSDRPFRIVYSGPTGAAVDSNPLVVKLKEVIEKNFKDLVVFLPNYNTAVSELMTSGCDVWLNTPVIGREACGTSGMKAALNGVLSLSNRDGWVAEADLSNCGWILDEPDINQKILENIENEITPMYYEHLKASNDSEWLMRMKNSRALIQEQFSATRMLNDYVEKLYLPIAQKGN